MPRYPGRLALLVLALATLVAIVAVLIMGGWLDAEQPPEDRPAIAIEPGSPSPEPPPTSTPPSGSARSRFGLPSMEQIYRTALALTAVAPETIRYRAALDARDLDEPRLAARLFRHTVDAGGVLAPMANLRLGQILAANDDREAAVAPFAAAIADGSLPASLQTVALTEAAANLAVLDRGEEALPLIDAATAQPAAGAFARAATLWDAARIRRDLDDPAWSTYALDAMRTAPGSEAALEALEALLEAGDDPPLMDAAQVNYRWRRDSAAIALYEEALATGTLTATETGAAWFYLGALAERERDPEGAIEAYAQSLEAAPDGPLAPDARYWRGRVYEELDDPVAAATEYDRLLLDFPDSRFVPDAHLRGALALGFADDGAGALARLESIAASTTPARAAEAARWHAVFRARFDAGAATLEPRDYHPAVLWSLITDETSSPLSAAAYEERLPAIPPMSEADIVEIAAWLAISHGPRDELAPPVLEDGVAVLAFALIEAGEPAIGRSLLFQVASAHASQPYALLDLAVETQERALYDVSMSIAERLLAPATPQERLDAPRPLLHLAYPAPFPAAVAAATASHAVPPLLLLAVVRQESHFNPDATSPAGAVGLGQVMPATGEEIAERLGERWDPRNLRDPETSLRYGAYYLATQLDRLDGDLLATLAAYNGGPGSAARWLRDQPFEGPDGFIYGIDFTETRAYVEQVIENYAWYRYLYADAPAPALP